MRYVKKRKEKK